MKKNNLERNIRKMGGKVIKFNLMGAIGVLILIITVIVGIVVFATRGKKDENKTQSDKQNVVKEEKNGYTELDTKENAQINGITKELTMRKFESKLGYKMDYDVDSFYIDNKENGMDVIKSLVSDTVEVKITLVNDYYNDLVRVLYANVDAMKKQYPSYELNQINNDKITCLIENKKTNDSVQKTYFIKNNRGYYEIKATCGTDFENTIIPIIDKMVESIEIM